MGVFSKLFKRGIPKTRIQGAGSIPSLHAPISGIDRVPIEKMLGEKDLDGLIKCLKHSDPNIREKAAIALGKLDDARAVGPLIKALEDEDDNVRWYSVESLGKLGASEAVEPLIKALKDRHENVRCYAAIALGKLKHVRAIEPLKQALNDASARVRLSASSALEKIGNGSLRYSLSQLSSPIFSNAPSASDDEQVVQHAYSLMQNTNWDQARENIQESLQICRRKDRLCELMANIYLNDKDLLAIGWYMQACLLGSPSWVPYLFVSYAARAIGLNDIAWRCLNACDVIDTGQKRIDEREIDIADIVNRSDRSQLVSAMRQFESVMDNYLPSADELPHDQMKRSVFLLQNIADDPEMQPLKQRSKLLRRTSVEPQSDRNKALKKCAICGEMVESGRVACPKCGRGIFEAEKSQQPPTRVAIPQEDTAAAAESTLIAVKLDMPIKGMSKEQIEKEFKKRVSSFISTALGKYAARGLRHEKSELDLTGHGLVVFELPKTAASPTELSQELGALWDRFSGW